MDVYPYKLLGPFFESTISLTSVLRDQHHKCFINNYTDFSVQCKSCLLFFQPKILTYFRYRKNSKNWDTLNYYRFVLQME